MKIQAVFVGLILLFASCNQSKKKEDEKNPTSNEVESTFKNLNRQWMIIEMGSFAKDTLVKYKTYFEFPDENKMSAHLGCNNINVNIDLDIKEQKMVTQNPAQTRMACEGTADTMEKFFISAVSQKNIKYILDGHYITLSSDGEQILTAIAADWD